MRRRTSRSGIRNCSRIVIIGSVGLRKWASVLSSRPAQLANQANWLNFEGLAKVTIFLRFWWTRGDSNPRPPRSERGIIKAKTRRHNQLAILTVPLIGKSGKAGYLPFSLSF